jgi:hypothetical protein
MMFETKYISVLSASTTGSLVFNISTYDNLVNITLAASGLSSSDTEIGLAKKIETQLNTILVQNNAKFAGVCYFLDQPITAPTFNVARTDHVVSISSQSGFDVVITTNTSGNQLVADNTPILITLPDVKRRALPVGAEDILDLTDAQIIDTMAIISAQFISITNNPIIATTYWKHETTNWDSTLFFGKTPVLDYYTPLIRRPILFFNPTTSGTDNSIPKSFFQVDWATGEATYRYYQNIVETYAEPFGYNNELVWCYVAGYRSIPDVVQLLLLQLSSFLSDGGNEFKKLQGGTLIVERDTIVNFLNSSMSLPPYFLGTKA